MSEALRFTFEMADVPPQPVKESDQRDLRCRSFTVVAGGLPLLTIPNLPVVELAIQLWEWMVDFPLRHFRFTMQEESEEGVLVFRLVNKSWKIESSMQQSPHEASFTADDLTIATGDFIQMVLRTTPASGFQLTQLYTFPGLEFIPLPKTLYREDTGRPFTRCLVCERDLMTVGTYVIEKGYRKYPGSTARDIIHDFAICSDCGAHVADSYSKESRERLDRYLADRGGGLDVQKEKVKKFGPDFDQFTSECFIKGTPRDQLEEYNITALCDAKDLLFVSYWPMMLSGKAVDEIMALLSRQTLDELDDFHGRHLGIPPEFRPLFVKRPVLI